MEEHGGARKSLGRKMRRREFLRIGGAGLAGGVLGTWMGAGRASATESVPFGRSRASRDPSTGVSRQSPTGEVTRASIRIDAILQAGAFAASTGDDARYHALVSEDGGAAPKSLLTTPASDREIAGRLRQIGAVDGGGVPMAAWTFREVPLVPWPDARVQGSPMRIHIEWHGWDRPRELADLLDDPGGEGISFRFGGNEEHDDAWESGCIACLYSCPGGVVSNDRYTIRDRVREATRFSPADDLPPDGTRVVVTLELLPA